MNRTAIVYDVFNLRHTLEGHPENFRRLKHAMELLADQGVLDNLVNVASTPAPPEAILSVHTPQYLERLQSIASRGGGHLDADTYVNNDSYEAALRSAGGLLNLLDAVMWKQADNGLALVRPPGHHARAHNGMGFCLFANVAVAARWAQKQHGVHRVLVVDFDVHHGNGTQEIFYHDPSVLFFSAHQFPYYPGTGAATELGGEMAYGSTINVPMPPHVGDQGYLEAFQRILGPMARRFRPELILLSAGFDAHWMDPLASMALSIEGYAALVQELMGLADELCGGRLVCVLEGGYHLQVLAHAISTTFQVLRGAPNPISDPFGPAPGTVRNVHGLLDQIQALHGIRGKTHYSLPSHWLDWGDEFGI
ncbi:MAG: histone deacetylase [Caldilineaceae bacterium]|nr:histone deacetylase [Caldilineaceae bacterium]